MARRNPNTPLSEHGILMMAKWQDPEYRKRVSEDMKKKWEDPDYRRMIRASKSGEGPVKKLALIDKLNEAIKIQEKKRATFQAAVDRCNENIAIIQKEMTERRKTLYEQYDVIDNGNGTFRYKKKNHKALRLITYRRDGKELKYNIGDTMNDGVGRRGDARGQGTGGQDA